MSKRETTPYTLGIIYLSTIPVREREFDRTFSVLLQITNNWVGRPHLPLIVSLGRDQWQRKAPVSLTLY